MKRGGDGCQVEFIAQVKAMGEAAADLSLPALAVYLQLFLEANRQRWPDEFTMSDKAIMEKTGIKWNGTIREATKELQAKGLITQERGGRGRGCSSVYQIIQTTEKGVVKPHLNVKKRCGETTQKSVAKPHLKSKPTNKEYIRHKDTRARARGTTKAEREKMAFEAAREILRQREEEKNGFGRTD